MASSIGFDASGNPRAVDEVEIVLDRLADHARRSLSFIGRIAVHQHKDVGVNVGEHATDDVSLALPRLVSNNRARSLSDVDGAIGGIVVVNVDCRRR